MSMFHELMMRKKEEIMYATIKGTLTENNGVFSGFSASNYLEVQGLYDCSKSFEVVLKIKTGASSASGFLRMANDGYGLFSALAGSGLNIGVWAKNTSDGYIANGVYSPSNSVPNNTDKFVKFIFTGTQYIIALSDDGINYTTTNTINNSTNIGNRVTIKIGATAGTQYFNGSIDLNNSYIKLGSTKYNLQAVVGYTVVGSPTITDGVASGFSSSNYLQISSFPAYTQDDRVEVVFNFTLTTLTDSTFFGGNGAVFVPVVNSSGKIQYYGSAIGLSGELGENILSTGQNYYFKAIYDTNSLKGYISTDGTTWILDYTKNLSATFSKSGVYYIGRAPVVNQYLRGTMNLNNTYIKVNNKLVFNGQQA